MLKPKIIGKRASAGAGKTFALALRYLQLLSESPPSSEHLGSIIAITFTNKAAAEMKERILRFLKEIAFETPFAKDVLQKEVKLKPEDAKAWIDTIIDHYFDFQVRTIDSFLLSILRGLSFELNLKPDSRVVFQTQRILEEVFNELLVEIAKNNRSIRHAWKEALETYLLYDMKGGFYPENSMKKHFIEDLYPIISIGDEKEFLTLSEKEKKEFEEHKRRIAEIYKDLFLMLKDIPLKLGRRKLIPFWEASWDDLAGLKNKSSIFDSLEKSIDQIKNNNLKACVKKLIEDAKDLAQRIKQWYFEKFVYCRLAGYYKILKLLKEGAEERSAEEGLFLGSEHWTSLILRTLRKEEFPPLVYAYFGNKFKHFLFDEFQDTSKDQWEAIQPLLSELFASEENGSLFVVGDPKQAIYGWRGGDWTIYHRLFDKKRPFFPTLTPEDIVEEVLSKNYRSHFRLVNFFNNLFENFANRKTLFQKEVQPKMNIKGKKSVVNFVLGSISDAGKEEFVENLIKAFSGHKQKSVHVLEDKEALVDPVILKASSKEEGLEKLKEDLVVKVKEEWETAEDRGEKTIAVLVKKNEQAEEVSSWLFEVGLPVITENALKIGVCPKVKGLISLLRLVENPNDELSIYGVLASGLMNKVSSVMPSEEGELSKRWLGEKEFFSKEVLCVVEMLKHRVVGYEPYELLWAAIEFFDISFEEDPFVERLLEVAHLYSLENGPGLSGFLKFWDERGAEERIGLPENVKAIRVLTIHKAKGLEFDTVFLPFTDWRLNYSKLFEEVEVNGKRALVTLNQNLLPDELQIIRDRKLAIQAQELFHLFYVALTRAKKRLYIYFLDYPVRGIPPFSAWMQTLVKEALEKSSK